METIGSLDAAEADSIVQSLETLRSFVNIIEKTDITFPQEANLGSGTYGVVRKGVYRRPSGDEVDCAVKVINSQMEIISFKNEVTQLSRVKHENIVTVYGACIGQPCYLVLEYAAGGSLYNVLHNNSYSFNIEYSVAHAISWCLQCIRGVDYLHRMTPKPLLHRDLKPPNLLLVDGMLTLKICDFGTATDLQTHMTNGKGSAAWMAPEVFSGNQYTEKCDIFSWGIILWEVLSRQKPFEHLTNAFAIMWAVNNNLRPPLLTNIPKVVSDLIQRCWHQNPQMRPTSTQVMEQMTRLNTYCDPADLAPLKCPIPLRSTSTSSTISFDSTSLPNTKTPIATQMPKAFVTERFPILPPNMNHLIIPDVGGPSTSRGTSADSQRTSPTGPKHRRQLSGDIGVIVKENAAPRKTSWPVSNGFEAYEDLGIQSHLLIEPRLQPLPPLSDSQESVAIYESHKLKCQWYYKQQEEMSLLVRRIAELDSILDAPSPTTKGDILTKYEELFQENKNLLQMEVILKQQVKSMHQNIQNIQTDDGWVFVQ